MLKKLLVVAAATDWRRRQIDIGLIAGIALTAPLYWWASGLDLWPGVALQLAVGFGAFVVFAALFALKWMGGGDVKLLTALALWIEPTQFLQLLVMMALVGGLLTIVMGAWHIARRDLNARFRGLRLLLVCIFLGTAALAAIGTLTAAIERELARPVPGRR